MGKSNKTIIHVTIPDPDLLEQLVTKANEYNKSIDYLVNAAIKKLLADIDELWNLRDTTPFRSKRGKKN